MRLLEPETLWSRAQALQIPSPVPKKPGIYAWYFRTVPARVPTDGCHNYKGFTLLYLGISPKRPPANGRKPSSQNLFNRIRYHYRGNAEGSTLRLTLGCLLAEELDIQLRRVGSGKRMTFGAYGESRLSEWMEQNALVAWHVDPEPWHLEEQLIPRISLPLNLEMNSDHPFHSTLTRLRREAKEIARALPIAP